MLSNTPVYVQVGGQKKNGTPVAREVRASEDLMNEMKDAIFDFIDYKTRGERSKKNRKHKGRDREKAQER